MLAVKDEEERCPAGEQLKCNPQQQQHEQQTKFLTVFFAFHKKFSSSNLSHIIFSSCVVLIEIQKSQFKTSSLVLWLSHTHAYTHTRRTYAYSYTLIAIFHCRPFCFFMAFAFVSVKRAYA